MHPVELGSVRQDKISGFSLRVGARTESGPERGRERDKASVRIRRYLVPYMALCSSVQACWRELIAVRLGSTATPLQILEVILVQLLQK